MSQLGPYTALGHAFTVDTDGDDSVLAAALDPLSARHVPGVEYRLAKEADGPIRLSAGDETIATSQRYGQLHHRLIIEVNRHAAESHDGPLVHGCVITRRGSAALLVGPSGVGKSTLTARLLQRGAALVAEDVCALDPASGLPRTYPRPLGLSELALQQLGVWPPDSDCGCAKHIVPVTALDAAVGEPQAIRVIASSNVRAATRAR